MRYLLLFAYLFTCLPVIGFAQNEGDDMGDEITISVEVKGIGNTEMPAIIRDKDVFVPINILFDFLKIKNKVSVTADSISGFYVNQDDLFLVDNTHSRITFKDTVTRLKKSDLFKDENVLYLNLKYYDTLFKLKGTFNFRRLAVDFSTNIELPAIREARMELMRRNVNRLRGDVLADTVIGRTYPAFHFGTADWAVTSTQQSAAPDQTKISMGLGGIVAGGETNASLNYFPGYQWDPKEQYYQWRYVNNDNPAIRQVMAGNLFTQSISSLYAPVVGIQFTNAPTTYRKSYGTYTISNTTDPNWIVELYVNSVLVDYKKTDASGFYTFDVPLIYGYSIIKLRFFGPYGEERTTQTYINIPFNFLPKHEFEYTAGAGVVEDGRNSIFSRVGLKYGLSGIITVGCGLEYLSSITTGKYIPFLNASVKIAQNLLVSGEYDYGVKARGALTWRLPSNIQLDLDYTWYNRGQTAIYYNYLEERKAILSIPIHKDIVTLFTRFTVDQISVPNANYTDAEWTITGSVKNVGLNVSNFASFEQATSPYLYGLFSVSFKLPKKVMFTTQVQYDYKQSRPVFMKYTFEKHILGNGFLNLSYQEFFSNNSNIEQSSTNYTNVLVGMRYDFQFTRVAFSALADNNKGYNLVESASGSLIYDHKSNFLNANNRLNVGKGEIAIEPFLDINCNGIRDEGEPRVRGIKLQINGGRTIVDEKDTVIRVMDLEAYVNYYATLSTINLDNISWQIRNHILKIAVSPNDFTVVELPVLVVGEVSGIVSRKDGKNIRGERQIIVNIYDSLSNLVKRVITESDGFFNYIGLIPGYYTAQLDSGQMQKLHLKPLKKSQPIHIRESRDGDVVDGLEFTLLSTSEDTVVNPETNLAENTKALADTPGKAADEQTVNNLAGESKTNAKKDIISNSRKSPTAHIDTLSSVDNIAKHRAKTHKIIVWNDTAGKAIAVQPPRDTIKQIAVKKHKIIVRYDTATSSTINPGNNFQSMVLSAGDASQMKFEELAMNVSKLYHGNVVCVLNDHGDIIDVQVADANGRFLMFDYINYRVTLPLKETGILSETVFLDEDDHIIETINIRNVNGQSVFESNSTEPIYSRTPVRIRKLNE